MGYDSTTDAKFLNTIEKWFESEPEIFVLIRFSYATGNKSFEFFSSFSQFSTRIQRLPERACVTAFKRRQLPIRGIVDDEFIERCVTLIPDGAEYLFTETVQTVAGKRSWFHDAAGTSHLEMREDLNESRGIPVAAGLYPDWLHDTDDVISAVVPDQDGRVICGIY